MLLYLLKMYPTTLFHPQYSNNSYYHQLLPNILGFLVSDYTPNLLIHLTLHQKSKSDHVILLLKGLYWSHHCSPVKVQIHGLHDHLLSGLISHNFPVLFLCLLFL